MMHSIMHWTGQLNLNKQLPVRGPASHNGFRVTGSINAPDSRGQRTCCPLVASLHSRSKQRAATPSRAKNAGHETTLNRYQNIRRVLVASRLKPLVEVRLCCPFLFLYCLLIRFRRIQQWQGMAGLLECLLTQFTWIIPLRVLGGVILQISTLKV